MRRYELSLQAGEDLEVILHFYWEFSPAFSKKLARLIRDRMKRVGQHPGFGTDVGHLIPGLRRVAVKDVAIYFHDTGHSTWIVRVLHGARDIDANIFNPSS